jgi:hypothetical protein
VFNLKGESMSGTEKSPSVDSTTQETKEGILRNQIESFSDALNVDEASIDPRDFAPQLNRKNASNQNTKTSLLFVLFEFAIKESIIEFQFPDGCTTIYKLDKFANASFHSHFLTSVLKWRDILQENEALKLRLIKQHRLELQKLTYPLAKKAGNLPRRKRGYSDKGSTRPNHQRGRSDKETTQSFYFEDLQVVERVVVYGRRPTVTLRRLPYSGRIREVLDLGLLIREGDFYVPSSVSVD